jgi:hypothetical protein
MINYRFNVMVIITIVSWMGQHEPKNHVTFGHSNSLKSQ